MMDGAADVHVRPAGGWKGPQSAAVLTPKSEAESALDAAVSTGLRPLRPSAPSAGRVRAELRRALDTGVAVAVLLTVIVVSNLAMGAGGFTGVVGAVLPLRQVIGIGVFALFWPVIFLAFGLYDDAPLLPARHELRRVIAACSVGTLLVAALALLQLGMPSDPFAVGLFWLGVTASTMAMRVSARAVGSAQVSQSIRRVLIVGSGPRAQRLYHDLRGRAGRRVDVIGFVDPDAGEELCRLGLERVGSLSDLERILMRQVIDDVIVALPIKSYYAEIQKVIRICERTGTHSRYLADIFECTLAQPRFDEAGEVPSVSIRVVYDDARLWVKRGCDILGALAGLVLLAPLMAAIAAGIKLSSPGPTLFRQERFGLNKRRFHMYKFRTMVHGAESLQDELEELNEMDGAAFKIENDPRITPFGRFLRRTSLDELPQFLNVLNGTMSLVGPRPLPVRDVGRFDEPWLVRRFSVRPGLTCLWQVGGRNTLGFDDWMALDLRYIDEWSLWSDLKILLLTVPAVVRGTGAR